MSARDPLVAALSACGIKDVQTQADLAPLTTLRVGGPARALVTAERVEDLFAVGQVCQLHQVSWTVIGRGSNVLVADEGFDGVVVVLGRGFRGIDVDGTSVRVGAAEPLPTLAMALAKHGLAGLAWAVAVPGSVGGGVRMNAGAHGGQIADHLVSVDYVDVAAGRLHTAGVDTLQFGYRHSSLPRQAIVTAATFALSPGTPDQLLEEIAEIRAWRRDHQPLNEPNCGSVFVNPPGDSAGRLIEASGAKGWSQGGASISVRHANFLVTSAGARADDVRTLIDRVRRRVLERTGIALKPEVVMLDAAPALPAGGQSGPATADPSPTTVKDPAPGEHKQAR